MLIVVQVLALRSLGEAVEMEGVEPSSGRFGIRNYLRALLNYYAAELTFSNIFCVGFRYIRTKRSGESLNRESAIKTLALRRPDRSGGQADTCLI